MDQAFNIRKTDSPFHDPVQSCRFVTVENNWFFLTREKNMQGPYSCRDSAEIALEIYLSELCLNELASGTEAKLPSYSAEELKNNVAFAKHLFTERWDKP